MPDKSDPPTQTIPLKNIPDEILETLLKSKLERAVGPLDYSSIKSCSDIDNIMSNKRPLEEEITNTEPLSEKELREKYVNEELMKYGVPDPTSVITSTSTTNEQPMSNILELSVLETMNASIRNNLSPEKEDFTITNDSLELLTDFTSQFIRLISQRLKRLTEIQRRKIPNKDDFNLLLREGYFNLTGLNEMYELSRSPIINKENIQNIQKKALLSLSAYNGTDDGGFNPSNDDYDGVKTQETWWIDQFIRRKKRKIYIPDWMPPLPPDYTFKSTPKYNNRITNPTVLREKSVNEGRLGEKALNHIMSREDKSIKIEFSDSSNSDNDDDIDMNSDEEENYGETKEKKDEKEEKVEESKVEDNEKKQPPSEIEETTSAAELSAPTNSENKFDLVELAKQRTKLLDKRRKEEEERIRKRVESDESHFGKIFGFYSNLKKLPDDINKELNDYRDKKLHSLVKNLQKQEKLHAKWLLEQEEKRKKVAAEKSEYTEANEIQIGMGSGNDNNNDNIFGNIDEEVEFDVEFSDMEDFQDSNVGEEENKNETKGLTVRFEDDVFATTDDRILSEETNLVDNTTTVNDVSANELSETPIENIENSNVPMITDTNDTNDAKDLNDADRETEPFRKVAEKRPHSGIDESLDVAETNALQTMDSEEPKIQNEKIRVGTVVEIVGEDVAVETAGEVAEEMVEEMDEEDIDMDMFED